MSGRRAARLAGTRFAASCAAVSASRTTGARSSASTPLRTRSAIQRRCTCTRSSCFRRSTHGCHASSTRSRSRPPCANSKPLTLAVARPRPMSTLTRWCGRMVQAAQLFADDLAAGPFRRCALSARGFVSDSRVRSEHRRTWPASPPDSRPERRSNIHGKWVPGNDKIVQDPPYPRGQWSAGASQLRRGAARAVMFRPRLAR